MKGIKRLLWLCAALCLMALAATGCGMLADNTVYATVSEGVLSADGSFYYDLYENGTVAVTGRTAADKHMVIPEKIDGHAVVAIGNGAFRDDVALCCVTLPSGVKTVGADAFNGCNYLMKIDLGGAVRTIGDSAFYNCTVLCEVAGTGKLERIGDFAFVQCASLSFIDFPQSLTYIGEQAFFCCSSLATLDMPEEGIELGVAAFSYCESLCRVRLGGLAAIPEGTFEQCTALVNIDIGKTVTSIGERAFRGCVNLTGVNVAKSVTTIGSSAFEETAWLNDQTQEFLIVGDGILMSYTGTAANVTLPSGVKHISDAFCGSETLRSITIGGKVESIGDYAFIGCSQLNKVVISEGVKRIGDSAFASCEALTAVYLPESLESIGNYAFGNCTGLANVYYAGKQSAWEKIACESGNEYLIVATMQYSAKP